MQSELTWKKGFFSNLYHIYQNDELIGKLKEKTLSSTAHGEYEGREYSFITKGFFRQITTISDSRENKVVGKIIYNAWMTRATISVDDKTVNWRYNNFWNTKWSLSGEEDTNIHYMGCSTKGKIESNVDDPLLILSGLFITNYYWQISIAIIIAVLLPAWISVLN